MLRSRIPSSINSAAEIGVCVLWKDTFLLNSGSETYSNRWVKSYGLWSARRLD